MTRESCDTNDSEQKCPKHFKLSPYQSYFIPGVEDSDTDYIVVDNVGLVDIEVELILVSADKVKSCQKFDMKPGVIMSVHPGVEIYSEHPVLKIYNNTNATAHFTIAGGIAFGANDLEEDLP